MLSNVLKVLNKSTSSFHGKTVSLKKSSKVQFAKQKDFFLQNFKRKKFVNALWDEEDLQITQNASVKNVHFFKTYQLFIVSLVNAKRSVKIQEKRNIPRVKENRFPNKAF